MGWDNVEKQETSPTPDGSTPVQQEAAVHTLGDMVANGFTFFTTALLTKFGGFNRDPIVEYLRARDLEPDAQPFRIDCERPCFQGLGPDVLPTGEVVNWDHRLYGVVDELWKDVRDFIGAIAWYDNATASYSRVAYHDVQIVDPTETVVTSLLPAVAITVFAVMGNKQTVVMSPAEDPPRTRPFPRRGDPREDICTEAATILGSQPKQG